MAGDVVVADRRPTAARTSDAGDRRARTVIATATARKAARSGLIWGLLFGALAANEALSYESGFPTVESRQQFAQSFGANAGLAAVSGVGRQLDTIEGFVAWRTFGLLIIVGAIWGLLTATRLLRGEEDAGRWELYLAGRTARRHATVQALVGLAVGFVVLWSLTTILFVAAGTRPGIGFAVSASAFYATALVASAAMFLAVGALASQLSPTRRQANFLGAAVFAVALVLRMVADTVDGFGWMRWISPLGWVENLHPLTGSQWVALVPITLLTAGAAGAAVVIAGWRDVGASALARPDEVEPNTRFLGGAGVLVIRLERWVAVAWIVGLGLLALVFGIVARTAGAADIGDETVGETVGRLGGEQGGAAAWIGYEFLYIAPLVAFAAAGQIAALRNEEADGHLDNLIARVVGRSRWLLSRLGFAVGFVLLIGLATGIGGWAGVAGEETDIGFVSMLEAGLNVVPPALFVLGVGTLLYGLIPRLAPPILYAIVLWSFVVQIFGSTVTTNQWLLDTSLLSHLSPVPAAALDWAAIGWLTGLGVVAALLGIAAFTRRDLASA